MKHEWKKHEKELYGVKEIPTIIEIPTQKFIMISGKGNPNDSDFSEKVGVLYSLAYPIKMRHKSFCNNNHEKSNGFEYMDYTVFPLEGIWRSAGTGELDKHTLEYTIMIRQPDFLTKEMVEEARLAVTKKKPHRFLQEIVFDEISDGLCVQMLHIGAYDDEPSSFAKMNEFMKAKGLERTDITHREIYLNNPKLLPKSKYKTILRYGVKQI